MITFIGTIFVVVCFIIFTHTYFDKKYKNTSIYFFIHSCFKCTFWLLPFIWFVFFRDVSHPQWTLDSNGGHALGAAIVGLLSPVIVIVSFLIGHTLFIALFMLIHFSITKVFKQRAPFLTSIILSTFLMTIFLQFIWWKFFYTEVSLPIRVYTWTLLILIAPWLPIMAALLLQIVQAQPKRNRSLIF